MSAFAERLDALLARPKAEALVAAYFVDEATFAGRLFDEVGDNPADEITPEDLFAVTLLDISFTGRAARELLASREIRECIAALPATTPLWEATDEALADGDKAWSALVAVNGVAEVTASKILARKRPLLVPIVDSVIVATLGQADVDYWRDLRAALKSEDRREKIEAMRPEVASGLSLLRVLDILAWMSGSGSRSARQVRAALGLRAATPTGT